MAIERMDLYDLDKYIRNSDDYENNADYFIDLYAKAWDAEFPNLPFTGSPLLEKTFDHVIGTFDNITVTWNGFGFSSHDKKIPSFDYQSFIKISFGSKIDLTHKILLQMLNETECLPNFGNHTAFVGFCVEGNVISITCNS